MDKNNIRRAAEALSGLSFQEWEILRCTVEQQFNTKIQRLALSNEDASVIFDRIDRERAGLFG